MPREHTLIFMHRENSKTPTIEFGITLSDWDKNKLLLSVRKREIKIIYIYIIIYFKILKRKRFSQCIDKVVPTSLRFFFVLNKLT